MSIAYYNGDFCKPEDVRIALTDRSVFFGDGIYDAAIGRNGKIYMQMEHISRFMRNAERMNIPLPLGEDALASLLQRCIALSGESSYFVYFQASRFMEGRAHACNDSERANLLITVTHIDASMPDKTLSLSLYEDKRYFYCDVKTLNLLPSVLASCEAVRRGFDEAVFLRGDTVTECAHSNISIIKNGELLTHPEGKLILSGTARRKLLDTALALGTVCRDVPFSKTDLLAADEVLVTSSTKLCLRAHRIEDTEFEINESSLGAKICKIMHEDYLKSTL